MEVQDLALPVAPVAIILHYNSTLGSGDLK